MLSSSFCISCWFYYSESAVRYLGISPYGLNSLDHGYRLILVVVVLGDVGRKDDLSLLIDCSLAVVGLHKGAARKHGP